MTALLPRARALLAALTLLALAPAAAGAALNPRDTSVQMFQWSWNDIATECTQWLGPKGFGAVQISPPGASKVADGWWGVYQPVNPLALTSRMGTPAELRTMVETCHAAGVRVYADLVINHLADRAGIATDGSAWDAATLSYPSFGPQDFHPNCEIAGGDYNSPAGRTRVTDCRLGGLPDLATESPAVQARIAAQMRALLDLGLDGFRIDAAKHMPPQALRAVVDAVRSTHPLTRAGEPIWITQEIIPDGGVDRADYFGIGTVNEFKFTYAMRDVFRGTGGLALASIPAIMGTPPAWGGSWGFMPSAQATVFVNNWDTERNGGSLTAANRSSAVNDMVGTRRYELANIYMLAQDYGEAQLHSGFRFTDAGADRPRASPYANGVAQLDGAWDFVHRWPALARLVPFRAALRGQPQQRWTVGDNANQIAFSRGDSGFVALNHSGSAWTRTFATGLPPGTYCNIVQGTLDATGTACTGGSVDVAGDGSATVTLPPETSDMLAALVIYTGQRVARGTCSVMFTVAHADLHWGQRLYVVGDQPALTPGLALRRAGTGANAPWRGAATLPARTPVQYRYVKWDGAAAAWEAPHPTTSGNREFTTCAAGGTQVRPDGPFRR